MTIDSNNNLILLAYLVVINLVVFALYGIDKKKAISHEFRISERVLLWSARLGGGLGAWFGMRIFRHKTKHTRFNIIVPLWMLIWTLAVYYVMMKGQWVR